MFTSGVTGREETQELRRQVGGSRVSRRSSSSPLLNSPLFSSVRTLLCLPAGWREKRLIKRQIFFFSYSCGSFKLSWMWLLLLCRISDQTQPDQRDFLCWVFFFSCLTLGADCTHQVRRVEGAGLVNVRAATAAAGVDVFSTFAGRTRRRRSRVSSADR